MGKRDGAMQRHNQQANEEERQAQVAAKKKKKKLFAQLNGNLLLCPARSFSLAQTYTHKHTGRQDRWAQYRLHYNGV